MKKTIVISMICLLFIHFLSAQEKMLTIDDAVMGAYRHLRPENLISAQWRDNDLNYTYVDSYTKIIQKNSTDDSQEVILEIKQLNEILKKLNTKGLDYFYDYKWLDFNTILFNNENRILVYNINSKEIKFDFEAPENAENLNFSENSKQIAYTIKNNLYFTDKSGKQTQITNYDDENMVCGTSVSRNEFGIDGGIFWSPNGEKIAFFKKNEDDVTNYPLVDITTRIASLKNTKYPMTGEPSENVALGVFDIKTGKTVWIEDEPDSEKYLTCITWEPSGENIYIAVLNREQNHMKLNKYNALTGDIIKTLFEEKHLKYVEPEHDLYFMKNNPTQFIWQSERDGFNHMYLYTTEGELIKQLTKGEWIVTDILGFDEKAKFLFYTSTEVSPLERHLYKLDLKKGKTTQISSAKGMHEFVISKNATKFIDSYSNTSTPSKIDMIDTDGKLIKNLITAQNPLLKYKMPEMEMITIKSADGKTDLHGRLVKPLGYKDGGKFPVVVYVYGGPHAQLVTDSWLGGTGLWDYYMAQRGYVVFTIDNRGSADRGLEFENVIHRQCGQNEMLDQMKGIEFLKNLDYVDTERIGVHGWSYGGFMTISLITNYPETFKVGVAGGPVIDWKYYEVMYGERYMDTPQENPEGFKKTSLLDKAKDLKGQLLIIHGFIDPTVVIQHSLDFLREAEKEKVLVDYYTYPTHEHNVRGADRIHLMMKVSKYFDDYLK